MERSTRHPNRRGEGARLREVILDAAADVLAREGTEEALTLRAVAREAGITAPAIYAHFADRSEILLTVVVRTFAELAETMTAAAIGHEDPVPRLYAVGHAYLEFAAQRPHHYRVLFERRRVTEVNLSGDDVAHVDVRSMPGADAFGVLLTAVTDCIRAGASGTTEPVDTANQVWVGLHGIATLRASLPWHPWPMDRRRFAETVISRLAQLEDGSRRAGARAP